MANLEVTKTVAGLVDCPEAIAYWHSLSDARREDLYARERAEYRANVNYERGGKLGMVSFRGPGSILATAIYGAYAGKQSRDAESRRLVQRQNELRAEAVAYRRGFAIVNGREYPLEQCPEFIRANARRIAREYGDA